MLEHFIGALKNCTLSSQLNVKFQKICFNYTASKSLDSAAHDFPYFYPFQRQPSEPFTFVNENRMKDGDDKDDDGIDGNTKKKHGILNDRTHLNPC